MEYGNAEKKIAKKCEVSLVEQLFVNKFIWSWQILTNKLQIFFKVKCLLKDVNGWLENIPVQDFVGFLFEFNQTNYFLVYKMGFNRISFNQRISMEKSISWRW